eukprot:TRINITY_DN1074_c0_g1_i1.p1 TRINITY_DN1074_c0_g1~~TRINITY_DN1074_c0_g1_i1.p1  ORF type:complete len:342 (+),score=64.48 TRINITY_DN1074_c0_g1_i1:32-1027(+)
MAKIVRSICYFVETSDEVPNALQRLDLIEQRLLAANFQVQTKRVCSKGADVPLNTPQGMRIACGAVAMNQVLDLLRNTVLGVNLDVTTTTLTAEHVQLLFDVIAQAPHRTFDFCFAFTPSKSSPYFPSADYDRSGFSIGLQTPDLSVGCTSLQQWLDRQRGAWLEIDAMLTDMTDYLGIDSSVAPLDYGAGSFVEFLNRLAVPFEQTVLSDMYTTITKWLRQQNPRPVGLCGMMFPCLEDFALADLYQLGQFSVERNLFLSLHSGTGIDTYPIGVDESPERVLNILKCVQALSVKHNKPLSVRFVSDGKAKIGERTQFGNAYLHDVVVRAL